MRVSVINTQAAPAYWSIHRKWPIGVPVECDVSDEEYAEICADARFVVVKIAAAKADSIVVNVGIQEEPVAERPKKGK